VQIYDRTAYQIQNYNHGPSNGSGLLPPNGATLGKIADGHTLRVPTISGSSKSLEAKCKLSYDAHAHLYFINSVSMCPDQATFVSADDLTVHLWNLERTDAHQIILDMRPSDPHYAEVLPSTCLPHLW
jgi:WD40 repeat protein